MAVLFCRSSHHRDSSWLGRTGGLWTPYPQGSTLLPPPKFFLPTPAPFFFQIPLPKIQIFLPQPPYPRPLNPRDPEPLVLPHIMASLREQGIVCLLWFDSLGGHFNIKMSLYQHRHAYYKDKMVYNGNPYTWKDALCTEASSTVVGFFSLYHTWVWNRGICMCVIVRPRSHMLIVLKKVIPDTTRYDFA